MRNSILLAVSLALCAATNAHHSTAMFDANQRVALNATIKELQWSNPHAWLQIIVANDKGENVEWSVEMGNPAAMIREGWKSNSLKPGDKVTVVVSPLKNGGNGGNLISVTRADGSVVGRKAP